MPGNQTHLQRSDVALAETKDAMRLMQHTGKARLATAG